MAFDSTGVRRDYMIDIYDLRVSQKQVAFEKVSLIQRLMGLERVELLFYKRFSAHCSTRRVCASDRLLEDGPLDRY